MIGLRKTEAATCSLDGAVAASIKLVQNYILKQFILQTQGNHSCFSFVVSYAFIFLIFDLYLIVTLY
jgi:hypothetical protein